MLHYQEPVHCPIENSAMIINCIILEDEKPAMDLMIDNVAKIPFLKLAGTCKNTFEANDLLIREKVDLIFSDIEMPLVSGLQFLKSLRHPPLIILSTAYEQYALQGYELEVIDYLLKPFTFERFLQAVNKAARQYSLLHQSVSEGENGHLSVYSEYKEIRIKYKDILYIEGLKDYVKILLVNRQRPILTRLNLKGMMDRLPESMFCRIHNSYIISLPKITAVQKTKLHLDDKALPIGSAFASHFFEIYRRQD